MLGDHPRYIPDESGRQKISRRLIYIVFFVLANSLYMLNNQLPLNHERAIVWEWAADSYIPLLPIFVIPYFYWYVQIIISLVWFLFSRRHPDMIRRYVTAIAVSAVAANLVFILLPTHVPRPDIAGSDLFSRTLRLLYQIDEPYNFFPSLHVAFTCIAGWFWHKAGPARLSFRLLNWTSCLLIVLATVFTKQHYLPDIPGGLILAIAAIAASELIWRQDNHNVRSTVKRL